MNIGILTFHWATNYGAVLQAFALQTYLKAHGHKVELIQYLPLRTIFLQRLTWIRSRQFYLFGRERAIRKFRKNHLILSPKRYFSAKQLQKASDLFDLYICGSDQVWNESFIRYSEKHNNFSYYLDFAAPEKKRIAYAASFGTSTLATDLQAEIAAALARFSGISVREKNAVSVLKKIGINGECVVDPTLLLERGVYQQLTSSQPCHQRYTLIYKLHHQQNIFDQIAAFVSDKSHSVVSIGNTQTIEEWLSLIRNADQVITNSFHGVVFCLIFQVPFIAVAVEHSKMNDRLVSLFTITGVQNRYFDTFDAEMIEKTLAEKIDWKRVEAGIKQLRASSEDFLARNLL